MIEQIKKIGFKEYAKYINNLDEAFKLENHYFDSRFKRCLCCADEGTPWGIHLAGNGILLSDKEFDEWFLNAHPDAISDHQNCGAAGVYVRRLMEQKGLSSQEAQGIMENWARNKASQKGLPYINIPAEKMNRPKYHDAQVCYYDGTGQFNYLGIEGLPKGFIISRKYLTKELALKECLLMLSIAFGDHGLGAVILTNENPFWLVAIGEDEKELGVLKKELKGLARGFDNNVVVDGFVANIV